MLARDQRFVTTLHDASIAHGFEFSRLRRTYKRRVQPWALRRAEAVVAVSAFARDEAVRLLGGEAARIRVIHSGPGLIEADEDDAPIAGQRRPYLLFVGTLADNKNLPFVVRAFDRSGADADLVLAGVGGAPSTSSSRRSARPAHATGSGSSRTSPTGASTGSTAARSPSCTLPVTKASASRRWKR